MSKTNLGLVEYVKKKATEPTIYMLGGFGRILSGPVKIWYHSVDGRIAKGCTHTIANQTRIRQGIGRQCFDCIGLIKSYKWLNSAKAFPYSIEYDNPSGSDLNCSDTYKSATEKGTLATMPDIPGILVFTAALDHVGVYIGRNAAGQREYIESTPAFGFWGVGKSNETMRKWTYWCKYHLIEYITPPASTKTYTVARGDSLSRIAPTFNMTWQELYELNRDVIGPNPSLIEVGMVLRLDKSIVFVDRIVEKILEVPIEKTIEVVPAIDQTFEAGTAIVRVIVGPKG